MLQRANNYQSTTNEKGLAEWSRFRTVMAGIILVNDHFISEIGQSLN